MSKIDEAFIKIYKQKTSTSYEREDPRVVRSNGADGTGAYRFDPGHSQLAAPRTLGKSRAPSTGGASPEVAGSNGAPTPSDPSPLSKPTQRFDAVHVEIVGFNPHEVSIAAPAVIECNHCGTLQESQLQPESASRGKETPQRLPQSNSTKAANRLPTFQEPVPMASPILFPSTAATSRSGIEDVVSPDERTSADVNESPGNVPQGFQAVWEVDGFAWPEPIEQLERRASKGLQEAGRSLRRACKDGLRIVGITGTGRGQGRSTVALQLAKTAAQHGLRVILIDADVDRPVLADRLGVHVSRGWIDALSDHLPLEEVAVYSVAEELTLLPLVANSAGMFKLREATELIPEAFDMLARNHDLVIVDCGDIGALGNLFHDQKRQPLQSAMLVTDQRAPRGDEFVAGIARLRRLGIHHLGVIENFVES